MSAVLNEQRNKVSINPIADTLNGDEAPGKNDTSSLAVTGKSETN